MEPLTSEEQALTDIRKAYVYIVECSDGSWYTGWTVDPKRRVKAHNSGKGAKYTRSRLPVRLIYVEETRDRLAAQRREYTIKQLSRREKERLVRLSCTGGQRGDMLEK